ncbi:MAG: ATP-binding cassette domain-containing protein [Caldithrix sp.]|nr:ATP-binding cassette domain-containing protein [Caldithrix sp.]
MADTDASPLLRVDQLTVVRQTRSRKVTAILRDVSFRIDRREKVALVGPSGAGKSMCAWSILGLLPNNLLMQSGTIYFDGQTVGAQKKISFKNLRDKHISMIFQEPLSYLNPVFKIGHVLAAIIRVHYSFSSKQAESAAKDWLENVGINHPGSVYHYYPHQLSGGMAQRVLLAMALSCQPQLLIADEPTTALDAHTQHQILTLIQKLQSELEFSILLISHDRYLVNTFADRCVALKDGTIDQKSNGVIARNSNVIEPVNP